jgi:tight adherence protein B
MFGIIYFVNPAYASRFFVDQRGIMMLAGAFGSIVIGGIVMAKMVRFEV